MNKKLIEAIEGTTVRQEAIQEIFVFGIRHKLNRGPTHVKTPDGRSSRHIPSCGLRWLNHFQAWCFSRQQVVFLIDFL